MCTSAQYRCDFLNYCMVNIDGYQSQSLMCSKLFTISVLDIAKLPKSASKRHLKAEVQAKWLHALQSTICCLHQNSLWQTFKFYGDDNLDWLFEELIPRFKQALSHLKNDNVFDSPDNCKVLISLLALMKMVEAEYKHIAEYIEDRKWSVLIKRIIVS